MLLWVIAHGSCALLSGELLILWISEVLTSSGDLDDEVCMYMCMFL